MNSSEQRADTNLRQVVKNWQLQSCDGLSLPFLINWLVGALQCLCVLLTTPQETSPTLSDAS